MHGRHETVSYCLNKMPFLEKYVCYSTVEDLIFLKSQDVVDFFQHPNDPIAGKWNASIKFLKNVDFDAVIVLGSDDYIDEHFLEFISNNIENYDLIGFEDIYFEQDQELYYWKGYTNHRKGEPAGAGKTYSRKFLERIEFNLFPVSIRNGLDGVSWQVCKSNNAKILVSSVMKEGIFLCDVKDGQGITPLSKITGIKRIK